ncbi:unnamed protein product [Phaeothamnion confervicola]
MSSRGRRMCKAVVFLISLTVVYPFSQTCPASAIVRRPVRTMQTPWTSAKSTNSETSASSSPFDHHFAALVALPVLWSTTSPCVRSLACAGPLANVAASTAAFLALASVQARSLKEVLPANLVLSRLKAKSGDGDGTSSRSDSANNATAAVVANRETWLGGFELAAWLCAGTTLQIVGVGAGVNAAVSAMLGYLTILLVPAVQQVNLRRSVLPQVWGAAACAFIGVFLLGPCTGTAALFIGEGGGGARGVAGLVACLLAPVFLASHDARLEELGTRLPTLSLVCARQAGVAVGAAVLAIVTFFRSAATAVAVGSPVRPLVAVGMLGDVLRCVAAAGWIGIVIAVAGYVQVWAVPRAGATKAQIAYACQPLWALTAAATMGGDGIASPAPWTVRSGAAALGVAVALAEFPVDVVHEKFPVLTCRASEEWSDLRRRRAPQALGRARAVATNVGGRALALTTRRLREGRRWFEEQQRL